MFAQNPWPENRVRNAFITLSTTWTLALASCSKPPQPPTGTLDLLELVTLRVPNGASDLKGTAPARAASGAFAAMVQAGRGGGIAVFDSDGAFIRELSAQGRGPGEFSDLTAVGFGPGDTLWAVERTRAQAFTPIPELRLARTVDFGAVTNSAVTAEGFLSSGLFGSEGLQPAALRDWSGAIRATFPPPPGVTKIEAQMGPVTLAGAGAIWFGNGERYQLSRIAENGETTQQITRELDWFPPDEGYEGALNVVRPPARLQRLASDDAGRLLVLSRRAHRNWAPLERSGAAAPDVAEARRGGSLAGLNSIFEYVLEVFATDGRLLASRDLEDGMQGLVDGSYVYQVLEDDTGLIAIRVWRIRVVEAAINP